ncbi:MAG: flagellar filament capping protein FliD [Hydrogenophaga sp.]|nr:flagellar filament capping protein FliD [Hydrogenophaga sp.]
MSTISSPGIGSGIDVQSIVSQLVALDKAPLNQLQTQANSIKTKISTYGTISSQVSALRDAASKLASVSGWNAVTATSSNSSAISVTAAAGAPTTSLTMEVSQLARSQSTASSALASGTALGTGTLTIELGKWTGSSFAAGGSTPVNITIGAGEDTLSDIAAKINDADAGVSATVLKDASGERLLLHSKETGEENGFRITATDDDGNHTDAAGLSRLVYDGTSTTGTTRTQTALNAKAKVNGVDIETASNKLSDSLPGLTLQLSQVTTAPVLIDVTTDTESIRQNVQTFVDAYNSLNSTLATTTKYDASTQTAGTLQGDSTAVGLQNAMRAMMRSTTDSNPFTRLSDIGISIQTGGAMSLDATKFDAALGDLAGLKDLFTVNTGDAVTQGFGRKIQAFADGLLATDGMVSSRKDALQKALDRNGDEQDKVTDRAARNEKRYLEQYNAMDAAVAKLSGLSSFVAQQITLWNKS